MKKIILLPALLILMFIVSCDNGTTTVDPQVRFYNTSVETYYFNWATYNAVSDSYTTVNENWTLVTAGNISGYVSSFEGTYYPVFDQDLTDSLLTPGLATKVLDSNKRYKLTFNGSSYWFVEE